MFHDKHGEGWEAFAPNCWPLEKGFAGAKGVGLTSVCVCVCFMLVLFNLKKKKRIRTFVEQHV